MISSSYTRFDYSSLTILRLFSILWAGVFVAPLITFAQVEWPPSTLAVDLKLYGPIYEAELEKNGEEYQILNQVLEEFAITPESILPQNYVNLVNLKRYQFVLGYGSLDEEWGAIKDSMVFDHGEHDADGLRNLLASNRIREPGLELALRIATEGGSRFLEGFRFVLDDDGSSSAEWFSLPLSWRTSTENIATVRRQIKELLLRPLWRMNQFMVLRESASGDFLPVQKDGLQNRILLNYCEHLSCPAEASEEQFYKIYKTGITDSKNDYLFAKSSLVAKQFCESLGLELISPTAFNLAARMRYYGFNKVLQEVDLHGVWIKDRSYRHSGISRQQYQESRPKEDWDEQVINLLSLGAGLVWCQLSEHLTPQPNMVEYIPGEAGWRFGAALGMANLKYSFPSSGGESLNLSASLSGFRVTAINEPEGHLVQFEQFEGPAQLSNPAPPIWLAAGNELYQVNSASIFLRRLWYQPRGDKTFWHWGVGLDRAEYSFHTSQGVIRSKKTSPAALAGIDLIPLVLWGRMNEPTQWRVNFDIHYSLASHFGYTLSIGVLTDQPFRWGE